MPRKRKHYHRTAVVTFVPSTRGTIDATYYHHSCKIQPGFVFAVLGLAGSSEYPTSHSIKKYLVRAKKGVAVNRTTLGMVTLISSLVEIFCQVRETDRPK